MFWVFNQFIPTALLTLLIFNGRHIRHFGFLIALALFFAPYPAAGIGIFAVVYAAKEFLRSADKAAVPCRRNLLRSQYRRRFLAAAAFGALFYDQYRRNGQAMVCF